jgi:CRP-like cAMP-binding protein
VHRNDVNGLIETTLAGLATVETYATGEVIFLEGAAPLGVYVVRAGSVDMFFQRGPQRSPRIAGAGHILGLSALVMQHRHECSAIARTASEIGFIERARFELTLSEMPAVWFAVLRTLSSEVNAAYDDLRFLTGRRRERRSMKN